MRKIRPGWKIIALILTSGFLFACGSTKLFPAMPTGIVVPTVTLTPTESEIVNPAMQTPTEIVPARIGTPIPLSGSAVGSANANQLKLFAKQGRGIPIDLALSRDGSQAAVGSTLGIYLFDLATSEEVFHSEMPFPQESIVFSVDGTTLASAGADGLITLFKAVDGKVIRQIKADQYVNISAMAFSPDGSRLVTSDANRVTHIFDLDSGSETGSINANARTIQKLSFAGSDGRLFSWAPIEPIKVWNLDSRQQTREISVTQDELGKNVINGSFSADGKFFAANSGLRVRIFNMVNGYTTRLIRLTDPASFVLLSGDGSKLLIVKAKTAELYTVDSKDDALVLDLPAGFPDSNRALLDPDGQSLWMVKSGLVNWPLEKDGRLSQSKISFAPDFLLDAAFMDSPSHVEVALMMDGTVHVLDDQGELIKTINLDAPALFAGAVSSDGKWLATSRKDKGTVLWSVEGKQVKVLTRELCHSLSFSSSGLLAGVSDEKKLYLWQTEDGMLRNQTNLGEVPQLVVLSANGTTAGVRTANGVMVWDVSGKEMSRRSYYKGNGAAVSDDGKRIAVSSSTLEDGSIISIYSVGSDQPDIRIRTVGHWMAFNGDDTILAVGGDPLTIWRVEDGAMLQSLPTRGMLGRPSFIRQQNLLALLGWDERLILWGIP